MICGCGVFTVEDIIDKTRGYVMSGDTGELGTMEPPHYYYSRLDTNSVVHTNKGGGRRAENFFVEIISSLCSVI